MKLRSTSRPEDPPFGSFGPFGPSARLALTLTLFGFAVAQPLYDLVGRLPTFFIYRHFQPGDFFLFVILVSLLLPALCWAILELLAKARPGVLGPAYKIFLGILSAAVVLPWLGRIEGVAPWVATVAAATLGGAAGHVLITRRGPRRFALLLTPSVVLFAVILLLRPGIRELWWLESRVVDGGVALGEDSPPIVLLVLDALPTASLLNERLEIDEARYPAFARLARRATWYRRATTVSTRTIEAVPAILSGRCPTPGEPPTFESHPRNLFTLLGGTYDLDVLEAASQLCPPQLCARAETTLGDRFYPLIQDASIVLAHRLLPPAWTDRLPAIDKNWGGFAEGGITDGTPKRTQRDLEIDHYRDMIGRLSPTARPTLRFAHLVLPHEPFLYLPSGMRYRAGLEPGGAWRTMAADPWVAWHGYQRHLLQLGYVDSLLGELLDGLEAAGVFDETLLVVTADHGSAFVPDQPRRELGQTNQVDLLAVPLFVKLPFQREGGANDALVQTVNVPATIAEALGLPPPSWSEGRSAPREPDASGELTCRQVAHQDAILLSLSDLQNAADRKVEQFGTGNDRVFPLAGPRPEVVGTRTAGTACPPVPGVQATFENADAFADVDPAGGFVPAEVVGTIYGSGVRELDLAVAVNGTVRATTRPYQLGSAGATFSAVVPQDSLRRGRNDIEVFAVGSNEACRLRPLSALDGEISFLDVQLGAWKDPRVVERGFTKTTRSVDTVMRWTRGHARLDVPLPPEQADRLRAVRIDLRGIAREGTDLEVRLGGRLLFEGRVTEVPWSGTFPVGDWKRQDPARIVIRSSTFEIGGRPHGVGVAGIWLLSDESSATR